jgi:hypothetical protein
MAVWVPWALIQVSGSGQQCLFNGQPAKTINAGAILLVSGKPVRRRPTIGPLSGVPEM